jgi:hypothetical protein
MSRPPWQLTWWKTQLLFLPTLAHSFPRFYCKHLDADTLSMVAGQLPKTVVPVAMSVIDTGSELSSNDLALFVNTS